MRALVQRVSSAEIVIDEQTVASINTGLLVLLGISKIDTTQDADYLLDKLLTLRVFPDSDGRMNLDVQQARGKILIVSQFTLYADTRRGRRPSFDKAAGPAEAQLLYDYFITRARGGPVPICTGEFQRHMHVHLVNDGPVTLLIDSADRTTR